MQPGRINNHGHKLIKLLTEFDLNILSGLFLHNEIIGNGSYTHISKQYGTSTCIELAIMNNTSISNNICHNVQVDGGPYGECEFGHRICSLCIPYSTDLASNNMNTDTYIENFSVHMYEKNMDSHNNIEQTCKTIANSVNLEWWCTDVINILNNDPDNLNCQENVDTIAYNLKHCIYSTTNDYKIGNAINKNNRKKKKVKNNATERPQNNTRNNRIVNDNATKLANKDPAVIYTKKIIDKSVRDWSNVNKKLGRHHEKTIELKSAMRKATNKHHYQ